MKEGSQKNVTIHVNAKLMSGRYFVLLDPPGSVPTSVSVFVVSKEIAITVS